MIRLIEALKSNFTGKTYSKIPNLNFTREVTPEVLLTTDVLMEVRFGVELYQMVKVRENNYNKDTMYMNDRVIARFRRMLYEDLLDLLEELNRAVHIEDYKTAKELINKIDEEIKG